MLGLTMDKSFVRKERYAMPHALVRFSCLDEGIRPYRY